MAEAGNNSGLLTVRLVTPDRVLLDATAEAVELPSMAGYMETLYGAAPLLAELGAGEVRLHGGSAGRADLLCGLGLRRGAAGASDHSGGDRASSPRRSIQPRRRLSCGTDRNFGTRRATIRPSTTRPTPSRELRKRRLRARPESTKHSSVLRITKAPPTRGFSLR
jgi:hypothetical protein